MPSNKSPSAQGYENKPFEAYVNRVNPNAEKLQVDSAAGPDDVVAPHPMLSTNAWIRALPERGARVITVSTAGGTLRRVVLGYFSRAAADLIQRYNNGTGLYRPMKPGEWDLMTPGVAYIYGQTTGRLHMRGGPVHLTLDPARLHIKTRAPTFRRELHEKFDDELLDEERFGVVVRHTQPPKKKNRWIRAPGTKPNETENDDGTPVNKQPFAKEYLRILGRDTGMSSDENLPEVQKLALHMEGDVIDAEGKDIKHSKTSKVLRELRELYDKDEKVIYQREIDAEKGAIAIKGTADRIDIDQKMAAVTVAIQQLVESIEKSMALDAKTTIDIKAGTTGRYSGKTSTILGPDPAPIDAATLGTTFNATVMTPLLTALASVLGAAGAAFTAASTPATFTTVGPVSNGTAGGAMTAAASTVGALASALATSLSTNVKVSK